MMIMMMMILVDLSSVRPRVLEFLGIRPRLQLFLALLGALGPLFLGAFLWYFCHAVLHGFWTPHEDILGLTWG